jgi:hypothetical protein
VVVFFRWWFLSGLVLYSGGVIFFIPSTNFVGENIEKKLRMRTRFTAERASKSARERGREGERENRKERWRAGGGGEGGRGRENERPHKERPHTALEQPGIKRTQHRPVSGPQADDFCPYLGCFLISQ